MALLTLTELLAISASESPYPSSRTDVLDALYGVSSIALGVGLVMVGVMVVRERRWTGWPRWLPLTMGVWVFVPMTPAMLAGFLPARLAISAWMLLYAALGLGAASVMATSGKRRPLNVVLQVAAQLLLALDRLEQRLEVALAEARASRGARSARRRPSGGPAPAW